MSGNPLGPGTKNITVNVPDELREKLGELAKESGLNFSDYLRAILKDAVESSATVSVKTMVERSRPELIGDLSDLDLSDAIEGDSEPESE